MTISPRRTPSLVVALSLSLLLAARGGGPLTPPGPPAPTGKSLQEISDQVEGVSAEVSALSSCLSEAGLCDGGSFLAIDATRNLSAWSPETGTWSSVQATSLIASTTSSEGNFLVVDQGRNAYAWSRVTGTWQLVGLDGILTSVLSSEGNFAIRTSTNRIYTWAFRTGKWNEIHIKPGITSLRASE